jgi:hypothetical protein
MKTAFFRATQALLLITGLSKLIGAVKWQVDLSVADPLLPFLAVRQTVGCAALLEIAVTAFLMFNRSVLNKAYSILWLCMVFVVYRVGLLVIGFTKMCPCLGYWGAWLHLSQAQVNVISESLLLFMILGSATIIVSEFLLSRRKSIKRTRPIIAPAME